MTIRSIADPFELPGLTSVSARRLVNLRLILMFCLGMTTRVDRSTVLLDVAG